MPVWSTGDGALGGGSRRPHGCRATDRHERGPCLVHPRPGSLRLVGPAFEIVLDTVSLLRLLEWVNRSLGDSARIGSSCELSAVTDRSDIRLWIRRNA